MLLNLLSGVFGMKQVIILRGLVLICVMLNINTTYAIDMIAAAAGVNAQNELLVVAVGNYKKKIDGKIYGVSVHSDPRLQIWRNTILPNNRLFVGMGYGELNDSKIFLATTKGGTPENYNLEYSTDGANWIMMSTISEPVNHITYIGGPNHLWMGIYKNEIYALSDTNPKFTKVYKTQQDEIPFAGIASDGEKHVVAIQQSGSVSVMKLSDGFNGNYRTWYHSHYTRQDMNVISLAYSQDQFGFLSKEGPVFGTVSINDTGDALNVSEHYSWSDTNVSAIGSALLGDNHDQAYLAFPYLSGDLYYYSVRNQANTFKVMTKRKMDEKLGQIDVIISVYLQDGKSYLVFWGNGGYLVSMNILPEVINPVKFISDEDD